MSTEIFEMASMPPEDQNTGSQEAPTNNEVPNADGSTQNAEQPTPNTDGTESPNPTPESSDNGGSDGKETPQASNTGSVQKTLDEILAESGISKEDFETLKQQKAKEKEEAEKPLNEQKRWAKIVAMGISEAKITKDDVLQFEELAKKNDEDLVFENFKKSYKSEYEDLTDDEFEEEARSEFESQYNARLIKQEAEKIRSDFGKKFNDIETEFLKKENVASMEKMHNSLFDEVVKQPIKETVEVDGQKIDIEIAADISMKEVKQALKSEKGAPLLEMMFDTFSTDKEASAELFKGFVQSLAKEKNYRESIANAVWKKAEEHFKGVYSVGAKAPFQGNSQSPVKLGDAVDGTEALIMGMRN